ncbi:MAG: EAL domain-containing protein [Lachnospiraceae bacterium]|nr:EAL domain-containing protein [Lachnospiraceae bacterium]
MEKIIYFDYAAVATFGLLIISCAVRKMLKGRLNRDFFALVLVGFISTFADIMAITFDAVGPGFTFWKYTFHTLYLFFHTATMPLYMIYIIDLTGTRHLTLEKPAFKVLMFLPIEFEAFALILNLVKHYVFYFNESGEYVRGILFGVNYLVAGFYGVVCIVHLFRFRKTLDRGKLLSIFALFPAISVAILVQYFLPNVILEMFACSICYLYVGLIVMRPEEMLDSETGLMKISVYSDRLRRAHITKNNFSIVMVDISNFRSLQHSLGYLASKDLLELLADKLGAFCKAQNLKRSDLYHLGNGRFRIVTSPEDRPILLQAAKDIQRILSEGFLFRNVEISMQANICILHWPDDIGDPQNMMLFDSQFLETPYKNSVLFAKEIMKQNNFEIQQSIDGILEDALNNKRFEVYYQPIYSIKDKRFTSAEALLRLKTEEFGFISPEIFIPAAERNGAIHRIGHYVLEEVCRFIDEDVFKELDIDCIDVNLSAIQCLEKNLAREISQILSDYHVSPSQINLEITETATAFGQNEMVTNIENLSARGFSFSLDDYGTGYSNLSRAINMPLSVIKLDKSITKVEKNTKLYAIGENTIRMIKDMNMQIVAEGIEDEKTLLIFEEMGCDYVQGFYFSKPLPKDEFIKFIMEQKGKEPKGKDYVETPAG